MIAMTVPLRAALYLRVSTARQAEHDVSIPDQKRQGEAYCAARGYQLIETYVEPGASATNNRRREFQRMIEAGTGKCAPFDIIIVHRFSRFFRDRGRNDLCPCGSGRRFQGLLLGVRPDGANRNDYSQGVSDDAPFR